MHATRRRENIQENGRRPDVLRGACAARTWRPAGPSWAAGERRARLLLLPPRSDAAGRRKTTGPAPTQARPDIFIDVEHHIYIVWLGSWRYLHICLLMVLERLHNEGRGFLGRLRRRPGSLPCHQQLLVPYMGAESFLVLQTGRDAGAHPSSVVVMMNDNSAAY